MGGGEEEDEGIKKGEISLTLRLRHQHTQTSECCTRTGHTIRHGLSNEGRGLCTCGQIQSNGLVVDKSLSWSLVGTHTSERVPLTDHIFYLERKRNHKRLPGILFFFSFLFFFLTYEQTIHRE